MPRARARTLVRDRGRRRGRRGRPRPGRRPRRGRGRRCWRCPASGRGPPTTCGCGCSATPTRSSRATSASAAASNGSAPRATPARRPTGPRRGDRGGRTRSCTSGTSRCDRPPTGRTPRDHLHHHRRQPGGPAAAHQRRHRADRRAVRRRGRTRRGPPSRAPCSTGRRHSSPSTSPASAPTSTCRWRRPARRSSCTTWLALREIPYARDHQLRPARAAGGQRQGVPRGRPGQRAQPDLDRRARATG